MAHFLLILYGLQLLFFVARVSDILSLKNVMKEALKLLTISCIGRILQQLSLDLVKLLTIHRFNSFVATFLFTKICFATLM